MTTAKWVIRWRYSISAKPVLPGVWRRKEGGFLVRGKVKDPRTDKVHQVLKALDVATALRNRFAALDDARVLRNLGAGPLLDAGADAGKLARFTQGVVGGVVHDLLYRLGYGSDQEVDESPLGGTLPGWRLVEVGPDGEGWHRLDALPVALRGADDALAVAIGEQVTVL